MGTSLELNAAYALTDHLGIYTSLSDSYSLEYEVRDLNTGEISQFRIPNNRYEIGIGRFAFDSSNYSWSAYAGYGFGNSGTLDDFFFGNLLIDDYGYRARFHGPSIQGSLTSAYKKRSYLSFLGKISYLNFYDFELTTIQNNRYLAEDWNVVAQLGLEIGNLRSNKRVGSNIQVNYAFTNGRENYLSLRNVNATFNLFLKLETIK